MSIKERIVEKKRLKETVRLEQEMRDSGVQEEKDQIYNDENQSPKAKPEVEKLRKTVSFGEPDSPKKSQIK